MTGRNELATVFLLHPVRRVTARLPLPEQMYRPACSSTKGQFEIAAIFRSWRDDPLVLPVT
jgi:hypothetical protein